MFSVLTTLGAMSAYGQYVVNGVVTDQETGEGLAGATVFLSEKKRAVTDFNGAFTFKNVATGMYSVEIRYVGYENLIDDVEVKGDVTLRFELTPEPYVTDEVIVSATRADERTPATYSTVRKEEIESQNLGQDLPFLLNWTPSLVTTSDAGAGVGYTGLRIRGSDATRINVTINGIPLNDSESQGVFWVDIPDIASSTQNIQIQRGVGTSTNGAGAFGGTINLQTNSRQSEPYGEIINGAGSYGTWRHTVGFGTGLIDDKWTFDGRVSKITSDGYLDRASSDLKSYYLSGGYYGKNTMVKAIMFGGTERTYQSWYGTPEAVLENDTEGIEEVIINNELDEEQAGNIRNAGRTFNWYLYEDQVDDYKQDHYQLHIVQEFTDGLSAGFSLHYTYGRGFYEQYQRDDDFSGYGLPNLVIGDSTINTTDLIRRRWLDNDFYGFTYSLNYVPANNWDIVLGGAYNQYRGSHFGEIIWAAYSPDAFNEDRYYDNDGDKNDFNTYLKATWQITSHLSAYGDVQFRNIKYEAFGMDSDLRFIDIKEDFNFFNPKLGFTYQLDHRNSFYATFARTNREPVRTDFIDSPALPEHETLNNLELGYKMLKKNIQLNANFYLMDYENQLVLTGSVNDVGSSLRENVDNSYRMGIEVQSGWMITEQLQWNANLTLSRNKIDEFTEVVYDYGPGWDGYQAIETMHHDTDISFSPEIIAGSQLFYRPVNGLELGFFTKYVGDQYLDNTSNANRKIDDYLVNDIRVSYSLKPSFLREMNISLLVNNIFDELYSSNGYTFGYMAGPGYVVRENYYFPQAETNFLASLTLKF